MVFHGAQAYAGADFALSVEPERKAQVEEHHLFHISSAYRMLSRRLTQRIDDTELRILAFTIYLLLSWAVPHFHLLFSYLTL